MPPTEQTKMMTMVMMATSYWAVLRALPLMQDQKMAGNRPTPQIKIQWDSLILVSPTK